MFNATGLWIHKDKAGNKFFSGNLGKVRVLIFKNTLKKEGSNEPDYNMYFTEQLKKEAPKEEETIEGKDTSFDDDIPF